MDWLEAKGIIASKISEGDTINTHNSQWRKILSKEQSCLRYKGEEGFIVQIGKKPTSRVEIPWSMLEKCFGALSEEDGYSGAFFKDHYAEQQKTHSCHVHVVGMIFVKAGIAKINMNRSYFLI